MVKKILELLYADYFVKDIITSNFDISKQLIVLLWLIFSVFLCCIAVYYTHKECKSIILSMLVLILSVITLWLLDMVVIVALCLPYVNIVCFALLIGGGIDIIKKKDIIERIKKININISVLKVKNNKWSKIRDDMYDKLHKYYDCSIYRKMDDINFKIRKLIKYNYHTELIYECEQKIFALIESSSCKSGSRYVITSEALTEIIDVINNFETMLTEMAIKIKEQENDSIKKYCNKSKKQRKELNELIKSMTKDIKELF